MRADAQLLDEGAQSLLNSAAVLKAHVQGGAPRLQGLNICGHGGQVVAE